MSDHYMIRLDVDQPNGKQPKLVGLAIHGFGWLLGGATNGDLTIGIREDGKWVPFDRSQNTQAQVDRFRKRFLTFDWAKNGRRNWPVLCGEDSK